MDETTNIGNWTVRLTEAIAGAVREFASQLNGKPVAMFAVDCQPWHGIVTLPVLTSAEAIADPLLVDPIEMAAWRHYDFTDTLLSWHSVADLGREMQRVYQTGDRAAVAEAFLQACAVAVTSPHVKASLKLLNPTPSFRVSVMNPVDNRELVREA